MTVADTLRDPETGLLNTAYFHAALPNRVATARRVLRPISIALLAFGDASGRPIRIQPDIAQQVAYGLLDTLRESDTPCRLDDGGFALILEDTPEDGAVWTVERMRRLLTGPEADLVLWAGIACYPAHALEAADLLAKTEASLALAREWPQSRIEVAATAD